MGFGSKLQNSIHDHKKNNDHNLPWLNEMSSFSSNRFNYLSLCVVILNKRLHDSHVFNESKLFNKKCDPINEEICITMSQAMAGEIDHEFMD